MFLSNFESSVDVKKRVSIPAPFRKSLGGQDSVYLWESFDKPCIEGCGLALVEHFEASISDLDLMDRRRFALATTILGDMVQARLDDGGRIVLDAALMAKAGITDKVRIVGAGDRFQIWEPARFEAMRAELRKLAIENLGLLKSKPGHARSNGRGNGSSNGGESPNDEPPRDEPRRGFE
jgi:MraZ protein